MDSWHWMLAPVAACTLVALPLAWFGLHVLQRGVIFVDLALAQVAALGTIWMVLAGHEPDEPVAYAAALLATFIGSLACSLTRHFARRVPPEALIGILYVVSAAAGVLLIELADDPHGGEKIQHLLVGNVVWVRWSEIGLMAVVALAVGLAHILLRRPLLAVSFDPEGAARQGVRVGLWDVVFYLTFGLTITAIVHVAGVLLVFSYLVIPAVIARLFADGLAARLGLALAVALPVSFGGVAVSYEHSAGPVIVVLLGAVLLLALLAHAVRTAERPARRLVRLGVATGGLAALLAALHAYASATAGDHEDDHHAHEAAAPPAPESAAAPLDPDALAREAATTGDPSRRLAIGLRLARRGDPRGLALLAEVAADAPPFLRMEAHQALVQVLGAPPEGYDPMTSPGGGWKPRAADPPPGWEEAARALPDDLP